MHPATQAGKYLAIFLIIMGVGTFLGVISNLTEMILSKSEKQTMMKKLNVVIGVFLSEFGAKLLSVLSNYDPTLDKIRSELILEEDWAEEDCLKLRKHLMNYKENIEAEKVDFDYIKTLLSDNKDFLLILLENPILLEHESFNDLMQACFHLYEELVSRTDYSPLTEMDRNNLIVDIKRVYHLLIIQWFEYMKYLKDNYPYLFSYSIRTNPFSKGTSQAEK
ncbi:MAG: two pore domain potassium channel family protein [Candidatus Helarchaeota archaeon]|nr:two pore domain potassium channel family protein [Candidatus Helarchaeota archaeon]